MPNEEVQIHIATSQWWSTVGIALFALAAALLAISVSLAALITESPIAVKNATTIAYLSVVPAILGAVAIFYGKEMLRRYAPISKEIPQKNQHSTVPKSTVITHIDGIDFNKIAVGFAMLAIVVVLYAALVNNVTSTPVYSNFFNNVVKGGICNGICHASNGMHNGSINASKYPTGIISTFNTSPEGEPTLYDFNTSYTVQISIMKQYLENVLFPSFGSNYSLYLEVMLAIATTLLGLYAVIFLEIVKGLKLRSDGYTYIFLLIAVLPFPFLISSISNIYVTFVIFQHLSISTSNFLFLTNFSIPNTSTYLPNTLIYASLVNVNYPNNAVNPMTPTYANVSADFLSMSSDGLQSLDNYLFHVLIMGLLLIIANVFVYYFYTTAEERPARRKVTS